MRKINHDFNSLFPAPQHWHILFSRIIASVGHHVFPMLLYHILNNFRLDRFICRQMQFMLNMGGSLAEWFRALDLKVPGSNPLPCCYLDLFSVVPSSSPGPHCVKSQLVSLPPIGILNSLSYLKYSVTYLQCPELALQC